MEISQYRRDGQFEKARITDPKLFAVAETFRVIQRPANLYVMDLALTPDGYKLIEFNPINCSGWYDADVEHVLDEWVEWTKAFYFN
ncbi:hypothetical protein D3C71_1983200 [compost metagenome]